MEFRCNLNCPVDISVQFCCKNCNRSKNHYVTKDNKHLWTEEYGFWSSAGCKLSRSDMPEECLEYDCKDYVFTVERRWNGNEWEDLSSNAIPKHHKIAGLIIEKGRNGNYSGIRCEP